jgi:hypothetical protein
MIYYTQHAQDRMRQRGITKKEVEYCLKNYHTSYPDRKGNLIYKTNLPSGKCLKVVVSTDITDIRVITVA